MIPDRDAHRSSLLLQGCIFTLQVLAAASAQNVGEYNVNKQVYSDYIIFENHKNVFVVVVHTDHFHDEKV